MFVWPLLYIFSVYVCISIFVFLIFYDSSQLLLSIVYVVLFCYGIMLYLFSSLLYLNSIYNFDYYLLSFSFFYNDICSSFFVIMCLSLLYGLSWVGWFYYIWVIVENYCSCSRGYVSCINIFFSPYLFTISFYMIFIMYIYFSLMRVLLCGVFGIHYLFFFSWYFVPY